MRNTAASWITAADQGSRLLLATEGDQTVDTEKRTISGLVVPYGKAGFTSGGKLRFSKGSLRISDPKRVKLLLEHDQRVVIGHGVEFTESDAGLVGTFLVPDTEAGTRALAEAALGLRDAFSVGVQLDDKTMTSLRRAQGAAVEASGDLRETSLVSVPAFDDARLSAAGAADLVVSSWTTTPPETTSASAGTTTTGGNMFTEAQRTRLAHLLAQSSLTDAERTERDQLQQLATAAGVTVTAATTTGQPATATASTTGSDVPAVVPAVAGAAHVTSEPSTYNFTSGESLVRDLYNGAMRHDAEAQQRVERFNAELADGNPASVDAFATAAATRSDVDGTGTDMPSAFMPNPNRPDLMRTAVDVKRPIISRLTRHPLTNAQPFAIPKVNRFEGVGTHTEGTPHRPAGSLTFGDGGTVQPIAQSGAWEVSRELLDAATPVLDRIAMREMLRDYARKSEGMLVQLIAARAAQAGGTTYGASKLIDLRRKMAQFVNDDDEGADIVAVGKSLAEDYLTELDTTDRPQLPWVGAVNALGTVRSGYLGFAIDGAEVFRASRLDTAEGPGAGAGFLARSEGVFWGESNVLQFRFDEVLGPGVIKLALWAYNAAALLDTADVLVFDRAVDAAADAVDDA